MNTSNALVPSGVGSILIDSLGLRCFTAGSFCLTLYLSEEQLLLRLPLPLPVLLLLLLQHLLLQLLRVGRLLLDGDPRRQSPSVLVLPQLLLRLLGVALVLTAHGGLAGLGHHLQNQDK